MVSGPQWADEADALLLLGVRTHGTRWRVISDRNLPLSLSGCASLPLARDM